MAKCTQAPSAVVMVRPRNFYSNPETAKDNGYQVLIAQEEEKAVAELAYQQVTQASDKLRDVGIAVHLFEDNSRETPDSVFPNNWLSTHEDGTVVIYPMYAVNRRKEKRRDIIELLQSQYQVNEVIDYSGYELEKAYLEGTGVMVLDNLHRVAYVARSKRMNELVLDRFCTRLNFEAIVFDAVNSQGLPVYHTNVLMSIGKDYAMGGFGMIPDEQQRQGIIQKLENTGRKVIQLSEHQIDAFCGNTLELMGSHARILAISKTAYLALTSEQIIQLESCVKLLPLDVSAIELAGGSVRCMLAGVHLPGK